MYQFKQQQKQQQQQQQQQTTKRTSKAHRTKRLLACCIPKLQFDAFAINFGRISAKFDANSDVMLLYKRTQSARQQICLRD